MDGIMQIIKSLEESSLLIKGISLKFLDMLLDTLGVGLLGNLLTGKEVMKGRGTSK